MRRKRILTILVVLSVIVVGVACAFAIPMLDDINSVHDFDSQQWVDGDARDRGRMVQSLVSSKVCVDMSAEKLIRLLGKPDRDDGRPYGRIGYIVDLGHRWPFGEDKYWLMAYFDKVDLVYAIGIQK